MGKKKSSESKNPNTIKITMSWNGVEGEGQTFNLTFKPDPQNPDTNLRNQLIVLANGFAAGTKQLMSLVKPLPQPTEEELKEYKYDFAKHGEEFGEGLFGLYNYKKALMEEFVAIVGRVLPDAFHDVLFVKGAQEKIFDKLREEYKLKKETEAEEVSEERKGEVS